MYVYILKLQQDKYYIGRSVDHQKRIQDHINQEGCEFTKIYPVINIIDIIETNDAFDEDKYVFRYMDMYGIENVRGGSFSKINLDPHEIGLIKKIIKNSKNQCYYCGNPNHFLKECPSHQLTNSSNQQTSLFRNIIPKLRIDSFAINGGEDMVFKQLNGIFELSYSKSKLSLKQCIIIYDENNENRSKVRALIGEYFCCFGRLPSICTTVDKIGYMIGDQTLQNKIIIVNDIYTILHTGQIPERYDTDFIPNDELNKYHKWCNGLKNDYVIFLLDKSKNRYHLYSPDCTVSEPFQASLDMTMDSLISRKGCKLIYRNDRLLIYMRGMTHMTSETHPHIKNMLIVL